MLATIRGLALEINTRAAKNDSTKRYSSLIMFEFGQSYPELKKLSLRDDQVAIVQSMCGQMVEVNVELFVYDTRTVFNLRDIVPLKKSA